VDEAVIAIDNKTIDKTKEEVKKALGNKYASFFEFDFKDDFSALRNEYIEKANHEWVLILDGHEYLDQSCLPYLKQLKKEVGEKHTSTQVFDFNIYEPADSSYFQQPRLFRSAVRYELPIHNIIRQRENRTSLPQVVIYHDQPIDRYNQRKEQRKKMNLKGLKEKADKGDVRSMYYLADAHYELKDMKNAEHWFKKYIPKSDFPHERYDARIRMALIYFGRGDYDGAAQYLIDCFDDEVNLNEHLLLMGDIKYKQENYYRLATTVEMPQLFLILNKDSYTWLPWYRLALAYIMLSDIDGVRECINKGKQLAPEREEFFELEDKLQERVKMHNLKKKGKLYVVASLPQFIQPYVQAFTEGDGDYYVRFDQKFNPKNADNADVIFCEWADANAIAVSNFETKAKKIVRVHAYEVFTDFIDKTNFYNIDQLIFVAGHIRDYFKERVDGWDLDIETTIISNGVDLSKFSIANDKKINNNIAWSGFISNKKGANLLLSLVPDFPEYNFHICGTFQEKDIAYLFENSKYDNLILYPWQDDLNAFFADKTFILNTSPREGCPVAALEGMAAGLQPVIYDWIGAGNIFKDTWNSRVQLADMISKPVDFKKNREFVELKYDFKEKKQAIKNLINSYIIEEKENVRKDNQIAV
jgi:hypothetical protein